MSILDGILKNIGGAPDDVVNLATKVGLDPAMVEQAIAVLGKTHQMDGDTVGLAAEKTGLSTDALNQIVAAIGGEGSLTHFASILDMDKDGNPIDDIMGMAGKLFGGQS
jgi:ATP phosphoribosyltransferase regulatory subunit HisZ